MGSHGPYFFIRPVLDGMGYEHGGRVIAQGLRLGGPGLTKRVRGDIGRGNAARFQVNDIMHTA